MVIFYVDNACPENSIRNIDVRGSDHNIKRLHKTFCINFPYDISCTRSSYVYEFRIIGNYNQVTFKIF